MTGKVWLQRAFPFVLPPVLWIQQPKRHQCWYHLHTWLCTQSWAKQPFRGALGRPTDPTVWTHVGVSQKDPVHSTQERQGGPITWAIIGSVGNVCGTHHCQGEWRVFFQLTHIHTCGARAYLYTSLYPLPIPCWCLETFSFGYWILSKPNPNRSEERKKLTKLSCTSVKLNVNIFFSRIFLSGLQVLVQKAEAIQKHSLN